MVLDYLVSPAKAKRDPASLLIASIVFVSFGVLVEMFIPSLRGSIIVFTMVPAIPLMWSLLLEEEKDEEKDFSEAEKLWKNAFGKTGPITRIINSHEDMLRIIAFFFLGSVIAYSFWFTALPFMEGAKIVPTGTGQRLFADQLNEMQNIRGAVTELTGRLTFKEKHFFFLLAHNMQVLGIMFLFCIVYGIGSMYMLLWNASIIGVVIGTKMYAGIAGMGVPVATQIMSNVPYANLLPFEVLKAVAGVLIGLASGIVSMVGLLPHGIFELGAYFVATIAGGLFSISLVKGIDRPEFKYILIDVMILTGISIIMIVIGAAIEASY